MMIEPKLRFKADDGSDFLIGKRRRWGTFFYFSGRRY